MGLFRLLFARNSTYVLGIVVTAFVVDRTAEIGGEALWRNSNKGVSTQNIILISFKLIFRLRNRLLLIAFVFLFLFMLDQNEIPSYHLICETISVNLRRYDRSI